MKLKNPFFILLIISSLFPFSEGTATIITFSPSRASGKVGDVRTFQIEAQYTHLPCLSPVETGEFSYEKVFPVSVSEWESLASGRFRKIVTVRLKEAGKGKIRLSFVCPIKQSVGEVVIDITKRTLEETYREAKTLLSDLLVGKEINLEYLKDTLRELITESSKTKDKAIKDLAKKGKEIIAAIEKIQVLSSEAIER